MFDPSILTLNNSTNKESILHISGLFVAIGHIPNTDIFKNFLDMDDNGYIITIIDLIINLFVVIFAENTK